MMLGALALVGASCGGDDDSSTPVTDLGDDGDTGDSPTVDEEIVAAYEASWNDFIRAGDPPQPDAPFLADHNTGEALTAARNLLQGYVAEGVVMRGTYEFDAEVVDSGDVAATVHDCGLNQLEAVLAATGEVVDQSDDVRDGLIASLVVEGGEWKVTSLENSEEVCADA
jgi:hypothetical protein